jgi:integrase
MTNMRRWALRCAGGEVEGIGRQPLAAARFLALMGWRSGEALSLRKTDIDRARRTATLTDSKTGRSIRPLSHAACEVLRDLPQMAGELSPARRSVPIGRAIPLCSSSARNSKLE